MYLDNVLSVGLMEKLFLSTDKSQFKRVSAQDKMWKKICLFPVNFSHNRGFTLSDYTVCPKYCVQKYACDILALFVYLSVI